MIHPAGGPGRTSAPAAGGPDRTKPRRSPLLVMALGLAALAAFVGLCALGTWQVHRRAWKLDLIARVDARIHAAPVAAPGPAEWPGIDRARDEYRRVRIHGHFLDDRETAVQAVTERGGGYWILTPLRTDQGFVALVNRGFVPADRRNAATRAADNSDHLATVTGLLRLTEPHGGFLRANDPAHDRWFSRDVTAIAATRHLGPVAPYFVDADATPNPGGLPIGGLTVIVFPNNHLVYAITWYGLALMLAGGVALAIRDGRGPRA